MKLSELTKVAAVALSLFTAAGASAADTITDSQGIVYNILSEPGADGEPGTCEVGDNLNYSGPEDVVIPAAVQNDDKA